MARSTDWATLFISIVLGIGLGLAVAVVGVGLGLPIPAVGGVTGGVVALIVPFVHKMTSRGKDSQQR